LLYWRDILQNHKGEKIEDEALRSRLKFLTELKDYERQNLTKSENSGILCPMIFLADDAYFALAELYRNILINLERAKAITEKFHL